MKKLLMLAALLALCGVCPAYTTQDILNGIDRRETIVVKTSSNVTYVAESTIGTAHSARLWVCSKIIVTTNGTGTVTVITYMPTLQIAGTNGANLAAFNYPND